MEHFPQDISQVMVGIIVEHYCRSRCVWCNNFTETMLNECTRSCMVDSFKLRVPH